MKNISLIVAGLLFTMLSTLHVLRFMKAWEITVNHHSIPLDWSLYGAIVCGLLAIWMFVAALKSYPRLY